MGLKLRFTSLTGETRPWTLKEIVQGKDLIADVQPPPEYIIESYLLVLQMVDETDPPRPRGPNSA